MVISVVCLMIWAEGIRAWGSEGFVFFILCMISKERYVIDQLI